MAGLPHWTPKKSDPNIGELDHIGCAAPTVVRYPAAPTAPTVALVKSRELRPSRGPHQALSVIVNVFRGMSADDFLEFMNLKNLVNFHTSLCLSGS